MSNDKLAIALKHHQAGRLIEAEEIYREILQVKPDRADIHNNLGVVLQAQRKLEDAIASYQQAVTLNPSNAEAYNNLGYAFEEQGKVEEAIASYQQSIAANPHNAEAHYNLGNIFDAAGKLEEAIASYQQAIALNPDYANAHYNLGVALWKQDKLEDAIASYQKALTLNPNDAEAHNNLGNALQEQGKLEDAIASYQKALTLNPNYAQAYNNLGNALQEEGKLEDAIAHYQKALALNPHNAEAHNNLGNAFEEWGKLEDAIAYYQQALILNPNYANAYNNLGNILLAQGKLAEAQTLLRQALILKPNFAEAHQNLAISLLLTGDFKNGFAEYEWRWQTKEFIRKSLPYPIWDGSSLQGKTILLVCEQGFGDNIQFIRYAPLIAQLGCRVIVVCYEALLRLFSTVAGIEQIVTTGAIVQFEIHAPLLNLPHLFGTTLETIPASIPYLEAQQPYPFTLQAPPETLLKVGIVWAGSSAHKNDRNRSCELKHFLSLLDIPQIAFYSLQKEPKAADLAKIGIVKVQDLSEKFNDFADTAAAIAQLDLIISVDTAVAHLAGAMGKPVWVLLTKIPDWRWMLEGEDSPWYPTMRLFRQSREGDWAEIFERVAVALQNLVAELHKNDEQVGLTDRYSQEKLIETINHDDKNLLSADGFNRLKKCRHGVFLYNINDTYIGRHLDIYGEYGEAEIELFQQIVKNNDLVVDVGANIGIRTLFFASAVGSAGTVMAFEPQRIIFQNLCANLALNSVINTYSYNVAVGDVIGSIKVPVIDYDRANNFGDRIEGELVQVITIDSLNLPYCRLINLDVGGMELKVLQGGANTIIRLKPILYIKNETQGNLTSTISYLDSLEYKMYWHITPFYNANNYLQNPENLFGNIVSMNMLCLHTSLGLTVSGVELIEVIS
ncbi:FkbM family methyltransferase [Argonema antarcticum]|uniref:FkbM family methyltransferase n=1 Tax=Argonema antarcticum TaxID=2942763 RepID=UPI002010EFD4|nr:FkbM family methyltransferase [Argonema antarcticum]MCL1470794.1 FkbM family methyltransferase [Argonema antarcticum A004/B2]